MHHRRAIHYYTVMLKGTSIADAAFGAVAEPCLISLAMSFRPHTPGVIHMSEKSASRRNDLCAQSYQLVLFPVAGSSAKDRLGALERDAFQGGPRCAKAAAKTPCSFYLSWDGKPDSHPAKENFLLSSIRFRHARARSPPSNVILVARTTLRSVRRRFVSRKSKKYTPYHTVSSTPFTRPHPFLACQQPRTNSK
jgi:hypothetical protein